jgi:hypothetical protein
MATMFSSGKQQLTIWTETQGVSETDHIGEMIWLGNVLTWSQYQ